MSLLVRREVLGEATASFFFLNSYYLDFRLFLEMKLLKDETTFHPIEQGSPTRPPSPTPKFKHVQRTQVTDINRYQVDKMLKQKK